jgi:hypothetical protein
MKQYPMEIVLEIDRFTSVTLTCNQEETMNQYNYTLEDMTKKVKKDAAFLKIMLTKGRSRLQPLDVKILSFLWGRAVDFVDDMWMGYMILKYTDMYQNKLFPCPLIRA